MGCSGFFMPVSLVVNVQARQGMFRHDSGEQPIDADSYGQGQRGVDNSPYCWLALPITRYKLSVKRKKRPALKSWPSI